MHGDPVDISVIIVSYNTRDLIGACLDSIVHVNDCRKEIFVVDNASTDGSAEFIRSHYPDVHFIANQDNRGFAAANNQAIRMSTGRYLFFLNPDTRYLSAAFAPLISFMEARPQVGLAGLKMVHPDGSDQESFSREYPGQKTAGSDLPRLKGSLAWVLGAGMFARSDILKNLGGFDESFFLYGEEQDLCLRIRKAGYEVGYCDSAVLVHLGGQSERRTESTDVWRKKLIAEFTFYRKHYSSRTVHRIRRNYLLKAGWRILTVKLYLFFHRDGQKMEEKLHKYEMTRDWIKQETLKQGN